MTDHPAARAPRGTGTGAGVPVVRLPADPTGPALAPLVHRLRSATRAGELVVDLTAARRVSPGVRRALHALHAEALRRGCTWTYRGSLPDLLDAARTTHRSPASGGRPAEAAPPPQAWTSADRRARGLASPPYGGPSCSP